MLTANGLPVISLRLTLPVQGVWVAALEVASEAALTGALTLSDDGVVTYAGSVVRSGEVAGRTLVEAVGGTGGLAGNVAARSYQNAAARMVVSDLLAEVGEVLDASATRAAMQTQLAYWTRGAGRASVALSTLTDALGCRWRALQSGSIWIGTDTWPSMDPDYVATELDRDAAGGTVLLAAETIALRPGVTFGGERIGRVEHAFSRESPLRTTAWLES